MTETAFPLDVSDSELEDLLDRVRRTRWAERWPVGAWEGGTDQDDLRRLAEYWGSGFDWRAQEAAISELPWRSAAVSGTALSYLRFDAERPGRTPVLLVNGWPSSALELVGVAQRLSQPSRFGGDGADSVTVIVPALPGFPFSEQTPSLDVQTHDILHRLMTESSGFTRYVAHGGDLGAGIVSRLAQAHPDAVAGIHLLAVASPPEVDPSTVTADERRYLDEVAAWNASEGAYQHQQQTRPLTLAPALADSPVGFLSWILEKHRAWSDSGGDVGRRFTDDYLLTLASLYWFTGSVSTSLRPYFEYAAGHTSRVTRVQVPTAVAIFPYDLTHPPRSWAERVYDVVRYTVMSRGGHFAPHEEPALLAADIREFLDGITA